MIDSGCAVVNVRQSARANDGEKANHTFRAPILEDACRVAELIASCPPLDANSLYCNLLQCSHFAGTCIIAERDGVLDGWISGYRPPDQPSAIFIWQVAVHERARGCGLGIAMIEGLLGRQELDGVECLKTTVTPSNAASRRMFAKFARTRAARVQICAWLDHDAHFGGRHETEELISIGPF